MSNLATWEPLLVAIENARQPMWSNEVCRQVIDHANRITVAIQADSAVVVSTARAFVSARERGLAKDDWRYYDRSLYDLIMSLRGIP